MIPAYCTNGLLDHRLSDALPMLADLGYGGVAITLDHHHLDPYADDLSTVVRRLRTLLSRHHLTPVIETGARYVLDPWHVHHPSLLSPEGSHHRIDLLTRGVRIASELGAPVMHLWSGTLPEGTSPAQAWQRLENGMIPVMDAARRDGVVLAVEPEPGMFLSTSDSVAELLHRLGEPDLVRMTLDLGHLLCNEDDPVASVRRHGGRTAHVQVDDMKRGIHDHLELGEGDADFPAMFRALSDHGYSGQLSVELSRHSDRAPAVARRSIRALREAAHAAGAPLRRATAEPGRSIA